MEKLNVSIPVLVEGRYDKIKLSSVICADIITTEGFGIFSSREKLALIKRIAAKNGIIVLTDSDGAGKVIRGYLSGALSPDKVYNLYIPKIKGREKRKHTPSKEGFLGVEGMEGALLRGLFAPFAGDTPPQRGGITKADFYDAGISGRQNSALSRDRLAAAFNLPDKMTANALLCALNIITDREGFFKTLEELKQTEKANAIYKKED